ncbi:AI-2E family transporter [Pelotalea chapellei]|uniref:AI-2E family transporter n=1 Tax=Pelotalea chapellei TaxID=44671 RepID=A0ABS5U9R4_9BACT|nr:AI-2E family transporter [Pelotalea chapellei]MBT1072409.1 AI-2E family transporter [Pelotalea chapellei]
MLNQKPAPSTDTEYRSPVIRIEPSPVAIVALLILVAGLWVLNRLLPVILVLVAALIIVGTISPAVRWLEERRMSRGMGIGIVFTALTMVAVLILTLTIPTLMAQVTTLLDLEPALRSRLAKWLAGSNLTNPLAELLRNVHSGDLVRMAASNAYEYSTRAIEICAYILSSIFLALYIMIDRDRLRGGLFLVVPRSHHIRLSRVMLNLETIVSGYIRGQVITSAFMAIFVFLLLKACGVSNALAIAVFAGAVDVLPYIGALLSVGAAVSAALPHGPTIIIVVLVLMVLYEEFESRVILPRIYGRALRLPSSVILFSLLAGSVLLGMVGALLALPVAAAVLMLIEELRVELPGQQEQAEDVEIRERDDRGEEEYERRAEGMPAEQAAAIAVEIATDRHKEENTLTKTDAPG